MPRGSIVFVHGTGVRLESYQSGFESASRCAAAEGIGATFVECAWGDPLGVEFAGKSLPDPPSPEQLEEEEADFARWQWLLDDPLFELDKLTIRDPAEVEAAVVPGRKPAWRKAWDEIVSYPASDELTLLLKRGGLEDLWQTAWDQIVTVSPIPELAFKHSAHELTEASHALARALVAELHVIAVSKAVPGPSRTLRASLVQRLVRDWKQETYAGSGFLASMFARAATRVLRAHRSQFSNAAALPVGDILLYQARWREVHAFVRKKIAKAAPPVTVVAHSLGGVACFDLFAREGAPSVWRFVTVGSQSPLLYELGALSSLKPPAPLPKTFPRWLNVYDRNDFLSYVAKPLFPEANDLEVKSGDAFPDSHGAYFGNPDVWREIRSFMA